MGTGYYGGIIDYLNYVNMKFGGVNGVKLTYEECETEYNASRTVECYQRLLTKGSQRMVEGKQLIKVVQFAVDRRLQGRSTLLKIARDKSAGAPAAAGAGVKP